MATYLKPSWQVRRHHGAVVLLLAALVMWLWSAVNWYDIGRERYAQAHLEWVEADQDCPPSALLAKGNQFATQGDWESALKFYAAAHQVNDPRLREMARYNSGVLYLRQAHKEWNRLGVYAADQINPWLDLAEAAFREVLRRNPWHFSARYNLELAIRIRPPPKEQKTRMEGRKQSIHAILPGVPGGAP